MIDPDDPAGARPIIHVPATVAELPAAQAPAIKVLFDQLLESCYPELQPCLAGMGGEGQSPTGDGVGDMWEGAARAERFVADEDRFQALAAMSRAAIRRGLMFAWRRRTKETFGALLKQGVRLRIEDKRARRAAEEATQQAAE